MFLDHNEIKKAKNIQKSSEYLKIKQFTSKQLKCK